MKLSESIENGQTELATCTHSEDPVWINTLKLLIEAGKRVLWHKQQHLDGYYELLPGETKE